MSRAEVTPLTGPNAQGAVAALEHGLAPTLPARLARRCCSVIQWGNGAVVKPDLIRTASLQQAVRAAARPSSPDAVPKCRANKRTGDADMALGATTRAADVTAL